MILNIAFLWASAAPVVINLDSSQTLLKISGKEHQIRCSKFTTPLLYLAWSLLINPDFGLNCIITSPGSVGKLCITLLHPILSTKLCTEQVDWIWCNSFNLAQNVPLSILLIAQMWWLLHYQALVSKPLSSPSSHAPHPQLFPFWPVSIIFHCSFLLRCM